MIPAKPAPYAAETKNSPASSWVDIKRTIATAWQAEPNSTVRRPPIRSVSQPQAMRLTSAAACRTDSIAAPCAAAMPISLQKATR